MGCERHDVVVLVVDDDDAGREVLKHLLELSGWTVCEAANGRAGLEAFRRFAPDLVITDIEMPKMGGIEMASRIRELPGDVPVVAVTRAAVDGRGLRFFDRVVRKPVARADLEPWISLS